MDDLTKRRPEDMTRINLSQQWEVEFWCKRFGCTKSSLISAVNAVGVSVSAVEKYLR